MPKQKRCIYANDARHFYLFAAEPPMALEAATDAVLRMASDVAHAALVSPDTRVGCDSLGVPALRSLLRHATEEGTRPHSNPKVLLPTQLWCSKNLAALNTILHAPPHGSAARIGRSPSSPLPPPLPPH